MNRTGTYRLLGLLVIMFLSISAISQTLKVTVDREKILIGEQIALTIKIEGAKAQEHLIKNWVSVADTFNHFEVVERGKLDTISVGPDVNYQQTITLTSFDSGQWQIPVFRVSIENRFGNINALTSPPISIDVLPVDVSQLQDYHDIKDIFLVENQTAKWILIAIAALTLISILAIYLLSKKKKTFIVESPQLRGKQTPLEWALASIDKLQKQELTGKEQLKQYYLQLTHICREYFQMQLQQKALQQTTDEWMLNLQPLGVDQPVKTSFFQFIRLADTVKFAKFLPPQYEQEQSVQAARQMLIEVDKWKYAIPSTNKPVKS